MNWYQVLGVPPSPVLDAADLEKRFHSLSKLIHPDRFARTSPRERRLAAEHTSLLNQAYRGLRKPDGCADYFLQNHGITVGDRAASAMRPEFLESMLEQRERLAQARSANDRPAVQQLQQDMESRVRAAQDEAKVLFDAWEKNGDRNLLERAALCLAELRYLRKFLDEAGGLEADAAENP